LKKKLSAVDHLENEVEQLNTQLALISKDRPLEPPTAELSLSGNVTKEHLDFVKQTELVQCMQTKLKACEEAEANLRAAYSASSLRVTVLETALQQTDGVVIPESEILTMQALWEDLGSSTSDRDADRVEIEESLERTCGRKINELKTRKNNLESEISNLQERISVMEKSLGIEPSYEKPTEISLHEVYKRLQLRLQEVEPRYSNANKRMEKIASAVDGFLATFGYSALSDDLKQIVDIVDKNKRESGSIASRPNVSADDVKLNQSHDLREEFILRCEDDITGLRLQKTKILVDNAAMRSSMYSLVSDMRLSEDDVLSLVLDSVRYRETTIPEWWNSEVGATVARAIVDEGGVARVTRTFTRHMVLINDALHSIARSRQTLSSMLRSLIERAQSVLLQTVGRVSEANDACRTFHDTLFGLPPLSKERILACITEVKALSGGVENMTQSEIEALTVVWEAIAVSTEERTQFWEQIDAEILVKQSDPLETFDEVVRLSSIDGEKWVTVAITDIRQSFQELSVRLFKLEKIHQEVEKQRFQQDAKGRILSLDSEIRILNAQLSEFEEKKCNKQRLLSKKVGSSNLLKEERFRKQMQTKFSAKLAQLAALLKEWNTEGGMAIDKKLLSDEVSELLVNSSKADCLVEQRTEFMHLRTVKSKRKREVDVEVIHSPKQQVGLSSKSKSSSGKVAEQGPLFSTKRSKRSNDVENEAAIQSKPLKQLRSSRTHIIASTETSPESHKSGNDKSFISVLPLSPLPINDVTTRKSKRPLLPPFGHVLAQALTPRNQKGKSGFHK
jgi:hypothetical protein